jgi:hypothetical protein
MAPKTHLYYQLPENLSADLIGEYPKAYLEQLVNTYFEKDDVLSLKKINNSIANSIPIYKQVHYLLQLIHLSKGIRLTSDKTLPLSIADELYQQHFLKDGHQNTVIENIRKESDSLSLVLTHILVRKTGFTKNSQGKLLITKSGEKALDNAHFLLKNLLYCFIRETSWSYFDKYPNSVTGQEGAAITLFLLHRFGHERRPVRFYASRYFEFFPSAASGFKPNVHASAFDSACDCYSLRTFDRFLNFFGLVEIEHKDLFNEVTMVIKTELMGQLFDFKNTGTNSLNIFS